ncbi:hypothetical protein BO71DRAFT_142696 [Aspergillus ellipticus CBS 707.79]|uniref:Uncharacterized protein n=1 Tax=Aspergillus ellipticus CBS 707.79 TaxID=1448320 RepID=A0A319DIR3_9EURO|nr:hypothetical protein BO71DRAFT_142696 [Aspergillus ellipticus CBS 707.79]
MQQLEVVSVRSSPAVLTLVPLFRLRRGEIGILGSFYIFFFHVCSTSYIHIITKYLSSIDLVPGLASALHGLIVRVQIQASIHPSSHIQPPRRRPAYIRIHISLFYFQSLFCLERRPL